MAVGAEDSSHFLEHRNWVRDVLERRPRVDEVERVVFRWYGCRSRLAELQFRRHLRIRDDSDAVLQEFVDVRGLDVEADQFARVHTSVETERHAALAAPEICNVPTTEIHRACTAELHDLLGRVVILLPEPLQSRRHGRSGLGSGSGTLSPESG